jgi:hypothetical protein
MAEAPQSLDATAVAAILAQRSRQDSDEMLDDLVAMLSGTVPGVRIERGLLSRKIMALRIPLAGSVYVLRRGSDRSFETSREQEVRGVVVRTVPMEIDAFLAELGVALDAELGRTEKGRLALRTWFDASGT